MSREMSFDEVVQAISNDEELPNRYLAVKALIEVEFGATRHIIRNVNC